MAPETILYNDVSKEATLEDLKKIDVWAHSMVLFKICNPRIRYPYHLQSWTKVLGHSTFSTLEF
jgi:hypothetical protein